MNKEILDACCGGRMMWFNKAHPSALYIDRRIRPKGFMRQRPSFQVAPDEIGDFTDLRYRDASFSLVVWDPPHTIRANDDDMAGIIAMRYGRLKTGGWQSTIRRGFSECWRVLKPNGTLIFKWAECDKSINELAPLFPSQPIFGSRVSKNNQTLWLCFFKAA